MNHSSHASRNSMSSDFLTFGNAGIEVNRAFERRAAEQARDRVAARLDSPGSRPLQAMRSRIGSALISVGRVIAGAAPTAEPDITGHGAA